MGLFSEFEVMMLVAGIPLVLSIPMLYFIWKFLTKKYPENQSKVRFLTLAAFGPAFFIALVVVILIFHFVFNIINPIIV